jgi:hypothetical protein
MIRAFSNLDHCMARLGFLKPLLQQASRAATNNLSNLGKGLISIVQRNIEVEVEGHNERHEEVQTYYLSSLPSRQGKLTDRDWRTYPYFAVNLGLLRRGTFSLLTRGQTLLNLISKSESIAWDNVSDCNPLIIKPAQSILLVFSFIEFDGDVLKPLYLSMLQEKEATFRIEKAGDLLPVIYRKIAKDKREHIRSGDESSFIQRMLDTALTIEKWKGKPSDGRETRAKNVIPRLEPFVDLGLLSKPDPFAYRYQVTDATRTFFEPLINAEKIDDFLHHSFFETTNRAFNLNAEHRADGKTVLPRIWKAYTVLKSPLGYVPILEVCLLAGIYSITESGRYFEISEATNTLKALQKERPELVRFNVDRWGALTFVKFNGDITKAMGG